MRQAGEGSQSLCSERTLVKLSMHWKQRPTLNPPMPDPKILRQPLSVVSGQQELIGLPQAVPLLTRECRVSTPNHVFVHGNDVEGRRVGGSIRIRIVSEPRNEACALGNFVRKLPIGALVLAYEIQSD